MSQNKCVTPESLVDYDKLEELCKQVKEVDENSEVIAYSYLEDEYRILAGKVLTIIDASIGNPTQNKCIKDLIRAEFHRRIGKLQDLYWRGKRGHSVKLEKKEHDPLN